MIGYLNEKENDTVNKIKYMLSERLADNLREVVLFGSKARGDYGVESDIDIIIVVKDLNIDCFHTISKVIDDVELDTGLSFSVCPYEADEFYKQLANSANPLMQGVKMEGIAV